MSQTLSPSVRRQEWILIFSVAYSAFVISFSLLIYFTWNLGSDWGYFSQHWPLIWSAIKDLIFAKSTAGWRHYWQQIVGYGWQLDFILHVGLPSISALVVSIAAGRLFYFPGGRDLLRHVSGPQLYSFDIAVKHAKNRFKGELREHPQLGLNLHPGITIPRDREAGNIFVVGAQGTGKTVFITPLIKQIIARGERAFVYDEKREFTSFFFDSKTCILIAPWDARGRPWNISADASDATRAQLIAERLIPSTDDPLWSNGARMILSGMVEILNHTKLSWGWSELADTLSLDEVNLRHLLTEYYPRAARFISENSKTTQSFFAQLLGSLGWIYTLANAWPTAYRDGFSITSWVNQPSAHEQIILVQADKRFKDIGAPIANALISLMTSNILAQTNSAKREYWLFIDELANLPRNDSLMEWMSLGRSKGCRIVAGTQSISQVQQIYTERGADSLLNMFTIFASMRVGAAGGTAAYTAKVFGERHVERPTYSPGTSGAQIANWNHETQQLVSVSDLVHLPLASSLGAEGYILIPGLNAVYRLRWPVFALPKREPEHIPADWLTQTQRKKTSSEKTIEPVNRLDLLRRRRNAVDERNQ